jgi:hypothetical protein
MMADALLDAVASGADAAHGGVEPATAEPLRGAPAPGTLADRKAAAAIAAAENGQAAR